MMDYATDLMSELGAETLLDPAEHFKKSKGKNGRSCMDTAVTASQLTADSYNRKFRIMNDESATLLDSQLSHKYQTELHDLSLIKLSSMTDLSTTKAKPPTINPNLHKQGKSLIMKTRAPIR